MYKKSVGAKAIVLPLIVAFMALANGSKAQEMPTAPLPAGGGKLTPVEHRKLNNDLGTMATKADRVFIGRCVSAHSKLNDKGFPITNYVFDRISSAKGEEFSVNVAGGLKNDSVLIRLSNTPSFEQGADYLLFVYGNDRGYSDPRVGNNSALKIVADNLGNRFVVNANGKFLVAIKDGSLVFSAQAVDGFQDGRPLYRDNQFIREHTEQAPQCGDPHLPAKAEASNHFDKIEQPLTLESLLEYLGNNCGLHFSLKADGLGSGHVAAPYKGGGISYCGHQDLLINIEQLPQNLAPWYDLNMNSLAIWNRYMDAYRYNPSNGTWGNNNLSEFGGFPTSASLISIFGNGYGWNPGTLAKTIFDLAANCGVIGESDVLFNPDVSFTDDIWQNLTGAGFMYHSTCMHELGHTWGLMTDQAETYDYDIMTVMHGGTYNVVEDGRGIHWADAYLFRNNYSNQTNIINISDVGVESYYALNGLAPSTLSANYVAPLDPLIINNLTVENNSDFALSNVRVYVYLSADSDITQADYFCNSFYWAQFNPESSNTGDYTIVIPQNVPTGYYYVGAIVYYNGNVYDAYAGNNQTFINSPIFVNNPFTSVDQIETDLQVDVYPNPTTDAVFVRASQGENILGIHVLNALGQEVSYHLSVPQGGLPLPTEVGVYFVKVQTEKGFATRRVLKN